MAFLAAVSGLVGAWAFIWPGSFHKGFPREGLALLLELGDYNEHATRDLGAFYLAFVALFVAAARTLERRVVRVALIGWLAYAIPHLGLHLTRLESFSGSTAVAQTIALGVLVLLPLILLLLTLRMERRNI